MEKYHKFKHNFKEKMRSFTTRVTFGQKLLLVVTQLFLDNLRLLNAGDGDGGDDGAGCGGCSSDERMNHRNYDLLKNHNCFKEM